MIAIHFHSRDFPFSFSPDIYHNVPNCIWVLHHHLCGYKEKEKVHILRKELSRERQMSLPCQHNKYPETHPIRSALTIAHCYNPGKDMRQERQHYVPAILFQG